MRDVNENVKMDILTNIFGFYLNYEGCKLIAGAIAAWKTNCFI